MAIFKKKEAVKKADPKEAGRETKSVVKKDTKEVKIAIATTEPAKNTEVKSGKGLDLTMVLLHPHVTEKASALSEHGVYVFEVNKLANKMHVRQAVEKLFKVMPVKISIINGASKTMKNNKTGRMQVKKAGVKKALVYLQSGDKIEFV